MLCSGCDGFSVKSITLRNSAKHTLLCPSCNHTEIYDVTILAPKDSPNTDGIDIGGQNAHIHHCHIDNGDDNVAVEASSDPDKPTSNILVENNYFANGHGASIGSIMHGYVRNITFRNIVFNNTDNGARVKTWQGGQGLVEDILYVNFTMIGVANSLFITQFYCPHSQHPKPCKNQPKAVTIRNITFEHIHGTHRDSHAGQFLCSDPVPCRGIKLLDIDMAGVGGAKNDFSCKNAHGIAVNVHPSPCLEK
eukprot:NODE_553_length_876_cov_760.876663_g422_i0.p1 GENE.NODE_553_length_876_cov_760.876663_g422_i0~~NODE_553_length_876_cov_760.876663_g422_i0.p1  ORF type:complete len:250 (-),score=15.07 NODE_553_length_876_cov_760.876663_g422_i0:58-807(-)